MSLLFQVHTAPVQPDLTPVFGTGLTSFMRKEGLYAWSFNIRTGPIPSLSGAALHRCQRGSRMCEKLDEVAYFDFFAATSCGSLRIATA